MTLLNKTTEVVVLALSPDELRGVSNALNEVCNGVHIDDSEFSTRLGATRGELLAVLESVSAALDAPLTAQSA